jgi:predicted nucleic acid-binding protein
VFILDGSVALAMLLPDEDSAGVDELGSRFAAATVLVPAIWPLEVSNGLLSALRDRRISAAQFDERLDAVGMFPVEVQPPPDHGTLMRIAALARGASLTMYDASYLDLAKERAMPLATLDRGLRKACATHGVEILP